MEFRRIKDLVQNCDGEDMGKEYCYLPSFNAPGKHLFVCTILSIDLLKLQELWATQNKNLGAKPCYSQKLILSRKPGRSLNDVKQAHLFGRNVMDVWKLLLKKHQVKRYCVNVTGYDVIVQHAPVPTVFVLQNYWKTDDK